MFKERTREHSLNKGDFMKKINIVLLMLAVATILLSGCVRNDSNQDVSEENSNTEGNQTISVMTTLFPYYDFVRQIAGDKVKLTMLVPTGADTHSFEPTPADMVAIGKTDVFIYNGGEMETWVPEVLKAVGKKDQITDCMMNYVDTVVEEQVEGMEPEEEAVSESQSSEKPEYDEHIWTSPRNAEKIVEEICKVLQKADPENSEYYRNNTDTYKEKLQKLDSEFQDVVDHSERKILVFGDKFPLRYFVEAYDLEYCAAFNGCSTETEPSASTVAYLIDRVKKEQVPVVYHIELSSGKIADTISEATGAKVGTFYTCHNVSRDDFDKGVTYLELMEKNVDSLKEGLN